MRRQRKIIIILTILTVVIGSYFAYQAMQRRIMMQLAQVAIGSFANYLTLSFDKIEFVGDNAELTNVKIFDFKNYFLAKFITSVHADQVFLKNIKTDKNGLSTIDIEAVNVRPERPLSEALNVSPLKMLSLDGLKQSEKDDGFDVSFKFAMEEGTSLSFSDVKVKDNLKQTALLDVKKLTVNNLPLQTDQGINQHYLVQGVMVKDDATNARDATFSVTQSTNRETTVFKDMVISDASTQKQTVVSFSSLTLTLPQEFLNKEIKPVNPLTAAYDVKDAMINLDLIDSDNFLHQIGYQKITGTFKGQLDMDPATNIVVAKVLADMNEVAKIQLGGKFVGPDINTIIQNSGYALPSMKLNFLLLQLENKTLLQNYLTTEAKKKNTTVEAVQTELMNNLTGLVNGFDSEFQAATINSVQKFLTEKKTLKVTLSPANPADIGTVVLLYFTNYSAIPRTLGIAISAE